MILTHELLCSAGTSRTGFNSYQLRLLGVGNPPKKGWLKRLVGTEIDPVIWDRIMKLKSVPKRRRQQVLDGNDLFELAVRKDYK